MDMPREGVVNATDQLGPDALQELRLFRFHKDRPVDTVSSARGENDDNVRRCIVVSPPVRAVAIGSCIGLMMP